MVTGDSLIVAKHVSKRVGIAVEHCIEGPQLALMDREQFSAAVVDGTVFARCTPHQKLQIISQLQVRCREQPHRRHEACELCGRCCWHVKARMVCMVAVRSWCRSCPPHGLQWCPTEAEALHGKHVLPAAAVACFISCKTCLGFSPVPACPLVALDAGAV